MSLYDFGTSVNKNLIPLIPFLTKFILFILYLEFLRDKQQFTF